MKRSDKNTYMEAPGRKKSAIANVINSLDEVADWLWLEIELMTGLKDSLKKCKKIRNFFLKHKRKIKRHRSGAEIQMLI